MAERVTVNHKVLGSKPSLSVLNESSFKTTLLYFLTLRKLRKLRNMPRSIFKSMKPVPVLDFLPQTILALVPVVVSIVPAAAACMKFSNDSSKLAFPKMLLHSFFRVYLEMDDTVPLKVILLTMTPV